MCVTGVLTSTPRWPHCEGAGMKKLGSGEPLSKELPERTLQRQVCSAAQREVSASHNTLPAFMLSLQGHTSFCLRTLAFTWLWRGPTVLLLWCCALASAFLHFVAFPVNSKKNPELHLAVLHGAGVHSEKIVFQSKPSLTFDMGLQVWTRKD